LLPGGHLAVAPGFLENLVETTMNFLTSSDLDTSFDEPRIQDLKIANALGFSRPRAARQIIERNADEIQRYGGLPRRVANRSPRGGRPSQAYYLNEPQALLVCMFSSTPRAAEVRHQVITVFMAWRRAQSIVPVKAHERRPSTKLDDAIRLKTNVDRLEAILHAHERAETLDTVREMMRDMRQRNEAHYESMRLTAVAIENMIEGRAIAAG
jgi:prophage antirepressor-like protein